MSVLDGTVSAAEAMEEERAAGAPHHPQEGMGLREFLVNAAAGTVGGVAGVYVGNPLDVVKVRMQTGAIPASSTLAGLRAVAAREGPRALFAGALTSAVGQAPNNAIAFGTYGGVLSWLMRRRDAPRGAAPTFSELYTAGSASGLLQSVAVAPFEHIKVQQQVWGTAAAASAAVGGAAGVPRPGLLGSARSMWAQAGFLGLYRGWVATVLRDAPTYGLYFLCYEGVKAAYHRLRAERAGDAEARAGAPAAAGVATSAAPRAVSSWAVEPAVAVAGVAAGAGGDVLPVSLGTPGSASERRQAPLGSGSNGGGVSRSGGSDSAAPPRPAPALHTPVWVLIVGGSLAGAASWCAAVPADVMKSRIQAAPLNAPRVSVSLRAVARQLYREAGVRGFFVGLAPCVLRSMPVNAVTFVGFEWTLKLLERAFGD